MPWSDQSMHERDPLVQLGWDIVGAMVKRRRHELGWTQRDLAERCSMSQPIVSRLENGRLRGLKFKRFAGIVAVMGGLDQRLPRPPFRAIRPEAFEPFRLDYAPPGSDLHQWLPHRDGGSYTMPREHGRSSIERDPTRLRPRR